MKKLLSLVLVSSLICSMLAVNVSAANTSKTYSAADISVNALNNDVKGVAGVKLGQYAGTTYSKGRVYKEEGILGLSSGEYGIRLVGREERQDAPYLSFDFGNVNAGEEFYYSMNVYIGEQRDGDRVYLGMDLRDSSNNLIRANSSGACNSEGENFTGFKYFYGNGRIKLRSDLGEGEGRANGKYSVNNWVNYTVAGDGKNITVYVDGVAFTSGWVSGLSGGNKSVPYSGTIKGLSPVVRLETSESFTGTPSFAVVKDVKLVAGAYTPSKSQTVVSGDGEYSLPTSTVNLASNADDITTAITGVSGSTTVSTFLSHITAPSGGSVSVIKLDSATKATIAVSGSETMTSDMKLLAKSEDGSMKLYDIELELSDTPTISSSLARYVVDDADKVITMPDTTVEKLTSVVTGTNGTTVKVVNAAGVEVTTGTVRDTMKLVAEKNSVSNEYSISLTGNTVAYNQELRLGSLADEQNLFDATIDASGTKTNTYIYPAADPANAKSLYGLYNGNSGYTHFTNAFPKGKGSSFTYNIKKSTIPGTDVSAYHVTNVVAEGGGRNWYFHQSNALSLGANTTNAAKGDKMVINFKVYIEDGGFAFWPMHTTSGGGGYELQLSNSTNKQTSDRVIFTSNKIQLGGERRDYGWGGSSGSYLADIGTYSLNQVYDVTVVESRGTTTYNGVERETVVTEGVYVNGVRLANSGATCVILDGRSYIGIRDFSFATIGDVYFGGLKITMMDNYDTTVPAAANLSISSASLEINASDSTLNGMPSVRGYSGTAAALKAAITKDANAELQVIDRTGTSIVPDSSNVADGMFLKVIDANDSTSYAIYIISNTMKLGNFAQSTVGQTVTATRTVQSYRNEGISLWLIAAKYDALDNLLQFSIDQKAINTAKTYNFSTDITSGGDKIKLFLWDNFLNPYCDDALLSEL